MHRCGKTTWRNKLIDVMAGIGKVVGSAPELRWPLCFNCALKTLCLLARSLTEFPEHMSRTNEPVFVRCIHLYRAIVLWRKGQYFWPEQGDIVIVNHVIWLAL